MQDGLPIKLGKEPLIDAIFEMRFKGEDSLSEIVPGAFFRDFDQSAQIQRLPPAEIPRPFREQNANLRYAATVRLQLEKYTISIGDHVLAIGCNLPYPGWQNFKPMIVDVIRRLKKLELVHNVERFSLKYVNIVPAETNAEQLGKTSLSLSLAGQAVAEEQFTLRVEFQEGGAVHLVQIVSGAQATLIDGRSVSGIVIDIDSIFNLEDVPFEEWASGLEGEIEKLRGANRRRFFSCLTQEAIKELEPLYE